MANTVCFTFGENDDSYFYNGPQLWAWQNLPPALQHEFRNEEYKYVDVFNIAIGSKGMWYIGGRRRCLANGIVVENNAFSSDLPKKLVGWLFSRDIRTLRVVFGDGGAFFAWDKDGYVYDCIPIKLAARLEEFKEQGGPDAIMPKCLALGYEGSFFFLSQALSFCYDLVGCSAQLQKELDLIYESHKAPWFEQVKHVSINPFKPRQYLILDRQGTAMGNYPYTWDKACNPVHHNVKLFFNPSVNGYGNTLLNQQSNGNEIAMRPSQSSGASELRGSVAIPSRPVTWATDLNANGLQPTQMMPSISQSMYQPQQLINTHTALGQSGARPFQQPQISSAPPPYPGHDGLIVSNSPLLSPQPQEQFFQHHSPPLAPSTPQNQQQEQNSAAFKKQNRMSMFKSSLKSGFARLPIGMTTEKITQDHGNGDGGSVFGGSNSGLSNNGDFPIR